jgi:Tol biopolymer transport system component
MAGDRTDPAELPRLGSEFGRYRLDALIGRGGMGVVFRATDTRLQRPVALKVLSPELATDPAFRARFVRESRLAASIDHPSIVPIYEAGAIGDLLFIALRFVPGRDLGSILRLEGSLEPDRTVAILRQVADALDAAHQHGLVHRDVKPANVLVEQAGTERAFLADFGLTRRLGEASVATHAGPLGTIDYMAPEQVEGGHIDARTDQYGLACVAVQCLTGSPPFTGGSDAAVLYAHVHADPPRVSTIDRRLSTTVDRAIARGLAKAPADRFEDCRSFVTAVADGVVSGPGAETPHHGLARRLWTTRRPRRPGRRGLIGVAAIASVSVLVAGILVAAPPSDPPTDGFTADASPRTERTSGRRSALGLAPLPGEVIYFASDEDGDYDLYALGADSTRPHRLTRTTRDERLPAVSPNGKTIAYVVGNEPRRDIWLMDADGQNPRPLVTHAADDTDPAWSADGKSLAFASRRSDPNFDIYEIRDRGDGLRERNARNLTARSGVEQMPDWASSGRRLVIASNQLGQDRDLWVIDADDPTMTARRSSTFDYDFDPDYSPNGRTIAFERRPFCASCLPNRGTADLFSIDARGGNERRLTLTPARDEVEPDWAPDGRALVFAAGKPGAMELFAMTPDGDRRVRLTNGWEDAIEPAWGRAQPGKGRSSSERSPDPGTATHSPSVRH